MPLYLCNNICRIWLCGSYKTLQEKIERVSKNMQKGRKKPMIMNLVPDVYLSDGPSNQMILLTKAV